MSDQTPHQCALTVERVGSLVVVNLPHEGQHYEIQLSVSMALRFGTALLKVAGNPDFDSLSDDQLDKTLDALEGGTT